MSTNRVIISVLIYLISSSSYACGIFKGLIDINGVKQDTYNACALSECVPAEMKFRKPISIYRNPSLDSNVVFKAEKYQDLKIDSHEYLETYFSVYEVAGEWLLISRADGECGWILPGEGSNFISYPNILNGEYLYAYDLQAIRKEPSNSSDTVALLPNLPDSGWVEVIETKFVEKVLWMKLKLIFDECEPDGKLPRGNPIYGPLGWIQAHDSDGEPKYSLAAIC